MMYQRVMSSAHRTPFNAHLVQNRQMLPQKLERIFTRLDGCLFNDRDVTIIYSKATLYSLAQRKSVPPAAKRKSTRPVRWLLQAIDRANDGGRGDKGENESLQDRNDVNWNACLKLHPQCATTQESE